MRCRRPAGRRCKDFPMWIAGRRDKLGSFAIAGPLGCRSIQANRRGRLRFFTGALPWHTVSLARWRSRWWRGVALRCNAASAPHAVHAACYCPPWLVCVRRVGVVIGASGKVTRFELETSPLHDTFVSRLNESMKRLWVRTVSRAALGDIFTVRKIVGCDLVCRKDCQQPKSGRSGRAR